MFLRSGNTYYPGTQQQDRLDKLPAKNFVVKFNSLANAFYLEETDSFQLPGKIYGDHKKVADRILNTYKSRPNSTGVLLEGEKGSGKTLLGKMLSIDAGKKDIPTLIINTPYSGETFNQFIQSIKQESIVFFDEFEKMYGDKDSKDGETVGQESLLTLLDGVFPSKKLFVLTCNDKYKVNSRMENRPGRIYYSLSYAGVDPAFVEEYCNDNLENKEHISKVVNLTSVFAKINFDMLKALVEEMNRYKEDPISSLKYLNMKPDSGSFPFDIEIIVDGKKYVPYHDVTRTNPLVCDSVSFSYYHNKEDKSNDSNKQFVDMSQSDIVKIDARNGLFIYKKGNVEVKLIRVPEKHSDFTYAYSMV